MRNQTNKIEWTEQWKSGQRWFSRLRAKKGSPHTTLENYAFMLYRFVEFKKQNPDEILAEYKRAATENLDDALDTIETELDSFVNWLVERRIAKIRNFKKLSEEEQQRKRDKARASAGVAHSAIRSWLKNNAKSLRGIPSIETYSEGAIPITMVDLKEILRICDIREMFYTLFLKDTGVSRAEAVKVDYADISKQLEANEQFICVKVVRRKEHITYETFIGPNAIAALKTWLTVRRQRGETIEANTPLFVEERKPHGRLSVTGLSQIYERLSKKSGIKVRTHIIRKFFETYMALGVKHPIILKYWMGHKVKGGKTDVDARYIIPPISEQRKLYAACYENIDINPKPDAMEMRIAKAKTEMRNMKPEEKRYFLKQLSLRHPKFLEHPDIKRIYAETTKGGDMALEPSFKEIGEDQLLAHLTNGWKIEYKTQNGRIIVKR